ncbi:prolyl-tRNA synthetase [Candidatus Blochmanniella pennsylvanica str. BPEN]|uniref:Proline--tRNA ligase n=1 Tax=Blochmanniella pennsylvanica (strain BPEN) TaxID=291272 RepID=SYP_BLOPB|nr:proline--tRNA ligase [Candidatus Blochmannia pennsylvanicus]Q493B4.1 RecName: Full=Proline--tRNA ligase; AltName: Full=Prolyl-tRNA synthetase; Short=ProRS [Candidatus Blochmannia pennsylvanicus str. BPEN]AAZ40928.1 prolyl-tRNA synthetase [Candidatus Blochmannia pennsylvanicus str. BPEN]
MRTSQYLLATLKEAPKNCKAISHQLMLRAGLIRQVSSGLYTWLPTGLRVLRKIENIIREEMSKIGAIEIAMPIVQPARLWKKSGRWTGYGTELLRFKNRNNQEFVLGPTHEEMVSEIICKETMLYKQFPLIVYQIHTKYRDEARPRSGVIRAREFIMKDGYSFHINQKSLQNTYNNMYQTYHTIFNRIGLNFCVVQAEPGKIGGALSHEFQAYSENGEDSIAVPMIPDNNLIDFQLSNDVIPIKIQPKTAVETMQLIAAPNIRSVEELINQFNLPIHQFVKTIIVRAKNKHINNDYSLLGLVIRADHQISLKKIAMIPQIHIPLSCIEPEEIQKITGAQPNLLGPINLSIPLIIDYNVAKMNDFVAGSNMSGKYFFGVNWNRDILFSKVADLHEVLHHNSYTNKKNILSIHNCIEIGHIFQLGQKYLNLHTNYSQKNNEHKHNLSMEMGCYGIGITRIIAVIIEQNYDKNGILWPDVIAPFKLAIIPIDMYRSVNVRNIAEKIYTQLLSVIGIDILIDDRKEYPGTMFADIDLIGIPHILIISDRSLANQEVEYKYRKKNKIEKIKLEMLIRYLIEKIVSS